jgi:RimJ/RimL family protein N-acetyltransferase
VKVIKIRRAEQADAELLWEWANDPEVRRLSFSQGFIPWEDHLRWFAGKLNDPHYVIFIVMDEGQNPIGQVRYELSPREAVISVAIAKEHRRKGYGAEAIREASGRLFADSDIKLVHAYVKPGNPSSLHSFVKAGFKPVGNTEVEGCLAHHLVLAKDDLS